MSMSRRILARAGTGAKWSTHIALRMNKGTTRVQVTSETDFQTETTTTADIDKTDSSAFLFFVVVGFVVGFGVFGGCAVCDCDFGGLGCFGAVLCGEGCWHCEVCFA